MLETVRNRSFRHLQASSIPALLFDSLESSLHHLCNDLSGLRLQAQNENMRQWSACWGSLSTCTIIWLKCFSGNPSLSVYNNHSLFSCKQTHTYSIVADSASTLTTILTVSLRTRPTTDSWVCYFGPVHDTIFFTIKSRLSVFSVPVVILLQ